MEQKENFGVYFIYCKNNWKQIFDEQIDSIKQSSILNTIKNLFLSINYYTDQDLEYIENKISDLQNVKIANKYTTNHYEFEALKLIKEICKIRNCNIFYIHTKGAGISPDNVEFYHGSTDYNHLQLCVKDWRIFMENYLLFKHKGVINELKEYDVCGVNLVNSPHNHFSGNFWWSKSEYINTLPDISELPLNFRWSAEFWIGSGDGKFKNFETNNNAGYLNRLNTIQTHHIHN